MSSSDLAAHLRQRLDSTLDPGTTAETSVIVPRVPDHELRRCIGRGNYGEVWLARGVTGQLRAVKVVWRQKFSSDRPYEREFQGIVRYEPISRSHPAVVPVLHVGRDDAAGFFYYVMELADNARPAIGESASSRPVGHRLYASTDSLITDLLVMDYSPRTLRSDLKQRGRRSAHDALQLGVQLAHALGHLHRNGLVHRDVKPSNVIYIDGHPRLADIGLVAGIDEARSFVGTEGFIPPEGPGTPQGDLFALGKLLYEAVTGRDRCDFPSLPEDFNEWPEHETVLELNEVLARACSPNPKLRHAHAPELAGDLNLLLAGRSIRRVYSVERRLRRFSHAALVASVLAVTALCAFWFQRTRSAEAEQRAARELALRQRAERAEAEKGVALRKALLEQARALVQSRTPDRRSAALNVLRQAGTIAPGADLRTVAVAALATPELREVRFWTVHDNDAFEPTVSPDMDTYVRSIVPGVLSFHRVSDDALVRTLTNGTSRVEKILFSADGHWLVTADKEFHVRLWNLEGGSNRFLARSSTWILDFSPDARVLYRFRSRGNLVREDVVTGERTEFPAANEPIYAMAVHPRAPLAVASHTSKSGLSVINLENGELMERFSHPSMVMSLAWNSTGTQLFAGCQNGSVWAWDWPLKATPRHILRHHKGAVTRLNLHPGGRWLVSGWWDGQSCLWDLENGQLCAVLPGRALGFSSDGTRLRLSQVRRASITAFDEAFQPRQLAAHRHGAAPAYLAFSPDGQWLVTGGEDGAWLWDAANWKPVVWLTDDKCRGVGVAANCSQVLVAGEKRWQAWELPSMDSIQPKRAAPHPSNLNSNLNRNRNPNPNPNHNPLPTSAESQLPNQAGLAATLLRSEQLRRVELSWAPIARLLWAGAVAPHSGRWISFEEPPRGRGTILRTGIAGSEAVQEMFFETKSGGNATISPNGCWTARGNWLDNDVWVIDLLGNTPPQRIAHSRNTATAFSSDSSEVVVCGEAVFRFITLGTWRERLVVTREVADPKPGQAAYAHRTPLVALQIARSRIRLIRPEDGSEYMTLSTHEDRHIEALAFSPDDHHLVAASPGHHLLVWDLERLRRQLAELGLNDL